MPHVAGQDLGRCPRFLARASRGMPPCLCRCLGVVAGKEADAFAVGGRLERPAEFGLARVLETRSPPVTAARASGAVARSQPGTARGLGAPMARAITIINVSRLTGSSSAML